MPPPTEPQYNGKHMAPKYCRLGYMPTMAGPTVHNNEQLIHLGQERSKTWSLQSNMSGKLCQHVLLLAHISFATKFKWKGLLGNFSCHSNTFSFEGEIRTDDCASWLTLSKPASRMKSPPPPPAPTRNHTGQFQPRISVDDWINQTFC